MSESIPFSWTSHEDRFVLERCPSPECMPWLDEAWFASKGIGAAPFNAAQEILARNQAARDQNRIAIHCADTTWTYKELTQRALRATHVIRNTLGIRPGQCVVLQAPNSPWYVLAFLAVLRAGGIVILCPSHFTSTELAAVVAQTRARIVLAEAPLPGLNHAACITLAEFERLVESACAHTDWHDWVRTAPWDPAILLFSSGSTGQPKAAVHYHRDLLVVAETYGVSVVPLSREDIVVGSPSVSFAYGLEMLVLLPMFRGASTIMLRDAGPLEVLLAAHRFRATHIFSTPSIFHSMLGPSRPISLSSVRTCVSAGEMLTPALVMDWRHSTGLQLANGLGSSEFNAFVLAAPPGEAPDGALGPVVPPFQARLVDMNGDVCGTEETLGKLAIRGPTGCRYFDRPAEQAARVLDGWTLTGDFVSRQPDGIFWSRGRSDDLIVRGGINIAPTEIESVIATCPLVADCAVVGIYSEKHRTQLVHAYVVLRDARSEYGASRAIRDWSLDRLARHKIPDIVHCVATLPRNHNGKLQRFRLTGLADLPERSEA